jgi:uncharacterized protein (TIGR03382 family)
MSELPPAAVNTVSQEANSTRKVLVLGSSVDGGAQSREAQAAVSLGYLVDVVTAAQWKAMRATDFMTYRALIIGDAACQANDNAFKAAVESRNAWGHIVDGNIVIIGADPSSNATPELVERAMATVVERPRLTGLYVALGCAYRNAHAGTTVPLLDTFGTFKVAGVNCANSAHLFAMNPNTLSDGLSDAALTGNGCAARSVFTEYPERNFAFAALGMHSGGASIPAQRAYPDYSGETPASFVGAPFILVRGAMAAGAGCGIDAAPEGEECDLGDVLNGQPALPDQAATDTCSWSCRTNWCGDGVVNRNLGEECDNGLNNGRSRNASGDIGACTASCKISPAPPNLPPAARCKDVELIARDVCGLTANVNDGSSDPEGQLVGCTQSPAGPYTVGQTTVTLTCRDAADQTASCSARVTVLDRGAPRLTLNGQASATAECGVPYIDPGVSAQDQCAGNLTRDIVTTGAVNSSVPGNYSLSYNVTDPAGNVAPTLRRTVRVADTRPPRIVCPEDIVVELQEGSLTSVTPGQATATDTCDGAVRVDSPKDTLFHEGETPLTYTATDAAGNSADCTSKVIVLVGPDTWIVQGPSGETESTDARFLFDSSKENVTYECSLNGVDFFQCDKLYTMDGLAEGPHSIRVRARDSRGVADPTPASATWTVLPRAPLWDGAMLGGGNGCSATGGGAAPLAMLGLVLSALLGARRRQR